MTTEIWIGKNTGMRAIQWTGKNISDINEWCAYEGINLILFNDHSLSDMAVLEITAPNELPRRALVGDWLVEEIVSGRRSYMAVVDATIKQHFKKIGWIGRLGYSMSVERTIEGRKSIQLSTKMVCAYCLADPYHTSTNQNPNMRCPKCAAPYNGPDRKAEFDILEAAGLVYGRPE